MSDYDTSAYQGCLSTHSHLQNGFETKQSRAQTLNTNNDSSLRQSAPALALTPDAHPPALPWTDERSRPLKLTYDFAQLQVFSCLSLHYAHFLLCTLALSTAQKIVESAQKGPGALCSMIFEGKTTSHPKTPRVLQRSFPDWSRHQKAPVCGRGGALFWGGGSRFCFTKKNGPPRVAQPRARAFRAE